MFNDDSWIKLWRKSLKWQWWTDPMVAHLYTTMLLKANINDSYWKGIFIPKGSFVSSINNLALESGLSVKQVRRAIKALESTGELAHKGHSRFSVFTILSWDSYQSERANKRHSEGKQRANKGQQNKKNNNIREEKEYIGSSEPEDDDIEYDEDGNVIVWITP